MTYLPLIFGPLMATVDLIRVSVEVLIISIAKGPSAQNQIDKVGHFKAWIRVSVEGRPLETDH